MFHAGVIRTFAALGAVASLASLVSCSVGDQNIQPNQQIQANQQTLIEALVPDVATVYVNFSCDADNVIGVAVDANVNGKGAWAVMRHPNQPISWVVAQNVTINSIAAKAGADPLPIDVDPNQHGGAPGVPYKATVKSNANPAPGPGPGPNPPDKIFPYAIGVTCKPAAAAKPAIHLVIDPEFIVRRP
jgi:hypothetical protein